MSCSGWIIASFLGWLASWCFLVLYVQSKQTLKRVAENALKLQESADHVRRLLEAQVNKREAH